MLNRDSGKSGKYVCVLWVLGIQIVQGKIVRTDQERCLSSSVVTEVLLVMERVETQWVWKTREGKGRLD